MTIKNGVFFACRVVDIFLVDSPATGLALSPTGDFLASSHVNDLGIYLWSNRTLYSHVSLRPLPPNHTPSLTELPSSAIVEVDAEESEQREEGAFVMDTKGSEDPSEENTAPLSDGLMTLSALPKSRWHNLQNLDVIKQRNKPIEPPKQPKQAPFFLPTLPGIEPKFVPAAEDEEIPSTEFGGSKILNLGKLQPLSEFQEYLEQCASTKQCKSLSLTHTHTHACTHSSMYAYMHTHTHTHTQSKASDDEIVIPV